MSLLTEALDQRFDDLDEVKDVSNHGCQGGVSGFIYYSEIRNFFFKYEDEINTELFELDLDFTDAPHESRMDLNGLITWAVWVIVESYCHQKLEAAEEIAAVV